jgi:hypothetical protein
MIDRALTLALLLLFRFLWVALVIWVALGAILIAVAAYLNFRRPK